MAKVVKMKKANSRTINFGKRMLRGLATSALVLVVMLSGCTKTNAKSTEYVVLKQLEVVGNQYYQYHFNDRNNNQEMDEGEVECRVITLDNTEVVNAQSDANVLAKTTNPYINGWQYIGEYTKDFGEVLGIEDATKLVIDSMAEYETRYVMRKLPEISSDGTYVRWYYFVDNDQDNKMDYDELLYHDEPIDKDADFVPAQPNANVFAVSDVMFVDGWQVYDIYDEKVYSNLKDISKIDGQIRKNENNKGNELIFVPKAN